MGAFWVERGGGGGGGVAWVFTHNNHFSSGIGGMVKRAP